MTTSDGAGPTVQGEDDSGGLREQYEVDRTLQEVRAGGYRRVALQFPDALLPDAPAVCRLLAVSTAAQLQQEGQEPPPTCEEEPTTTAPPPFFFIIGDTSYGACCADEVAAQHLLADCIVHYGPACLSPTARLPVVHVFGRRPLRDPQTAAAGIARALREGGNDNGEAAAPVRRALLFYDLGYSHAIPELSRLLQAHLDDIEVVVARLPPRPSVAASPSGGEGSCGGGQGEGCCGSTVPAVIAQQEQEEPQPKEKAEAEAGGEQERGPRTVIAGGLEVVLPDDDEGDQEEGRRTVVVYIGPAAGKQLATIMLRFNRLGACLVHDPAAAAPGADAGARWEALATHRELKRRYYMVQRARDAQVLGIVVGTLGVSRYLRVVASVRRLVERAGKKAYTLVVGKLNPAKLANFAEIEAFVLVACPESSLLPDGGRDFHAPIVTPLELQMALGGRAWDGFYSTDFRDLASLFAAADEEEDDDDKGGERRETQEGEEEEEGDSPYFSLVSGGFKARAAAASSASASVAGSSSVGGSGQLLAYHSPAGEFLQLREYRGLGHDKPAGPGAEGEDGEGAQPPAGIVEGRRGIAADYGGF